MATALLPLSSSPTILKRAFLLSLRFSSSQTALSLSSFTPHRAATAALPAGVPLPSVSKRVFYLPRLLLLRALSSSNTNNPSSFDWSDDDETTAAGKTNIKNPSPKTLPPPYDPFSKKPAIEEPADPSNLQEIFHKMRADGLTNNAVKMFDALSKDGLTHEALELFGVIKDKGAMPDVVAHTAVIEAYANAGGHSKEAIRTFNRMLAAGVSPNTYTYAVLVKGLARDSKIVEARKYLVEMMGRGMRPNAATYVAVFEAYLREQLVEDARILLDEMKGKGFSPNEKDVRDCLGKRGQVFRGIMSLLFGK